MKRLRIYVDTSVIGGCLDVEFAAESQRFIEAVRNNKVVMLLSDLVISELVDAPPNVRDILTTLPTEVIEDVLLTEEIIALRDAYIAAGVVTSKSINDAAHVATATVARADAIVSWNFKHIVRLDKSLGLWQGEFEEITRRWLRWYDYQGNWVPTDAERVEKAEARLQQVALNLLRQGMTTEQVAQLTGLSLERVQQLAHEH